MRQELPFRRHEREEGIESSHRRKTHWRGRSLKERTLGYQWQKPSKMCWGQGWGDNTDYLDSVGHPCNHGAYLAAHGLLLEPQLRFLTPASDSVLQLLKSIPQCTTQSELRGHTLDSVGIRIQILVAYDLVAGGRTLPADDRTPGQEELPDPVPPLAVLCGHLGFVAQPVPVPSPEGGRVVDADRVDRLDLEAGGLERGDEPGQWGGRVCAGEDIPASWSVRELLISKGSSNALVHKESPDEIFVQPWLA